MFVCKRVQRFTILEIVGKPKFCYKIRDEIGVVHSGETDRYTI